MKPSLDSLQHWFHAAIQQSPEDRLSQKQLESLSKLPRLSAEEQLEVYREQYWLRHRGSLREDFPALLAFLGENDFDVLTKEYLRVRPPQSYSLAALAEDFPRFLRERIPGVATLAVELAALEAALCRVFLAPNDEKLTRASVEQLSPEELGASSLRPIRALELLRFEHAVPDIRRSLLSAPRDELPKWLPKQVHLVLYRSDDFQLFDKEISETKWLLLEQLSSNKSLVEACENVAGQGPNHQAALEENLAEWFAEFTSLGLLAKLRPHN